MPGRSAPRISAGPASAGRSHRISEAVIKATDVRMMWGLVMRSAAPLAALLRGVSHLDHAPGSRPVLARVYPPVWNFSDPAKPIGCFPVTCITVEQLVSARRAGMPRHHASREVLRLASRSSFVVGLWLVAASPCPWAGHRGVGARNRQRPPASSARPVNSIERTIRR